MKKRGIALFLVLALMLSLCAVSAVAGEEPEETTGTTEAADGETGADGEVTGEEGETSEEVEEEPVSPAGPDALEEDSSAWETTLDEETQKLLDEVTRTTEKLDTISFADVESRMRMGNLTILSLEESVTMLKSIDYDELYEDLRDQLTSIAQGQWMMVQMGASGTLAYEQMDQAYDAVRDQFDSIKDGEMQEDNAGAIRQLKNLQDQIILAGESTYIALAAMDTQEASLQRQLASMNRTVEEMELRYNMGQVSAMQLSEIKAGQTALASGLQTLQMNLKTYKMQLELLLGAELNGGIQLGAIPEATEKQLAAMDLDQDLLTAKANSYELYEAAKTLEDEQETYKEAGKDHGYNEKKLEFRKAKHTWQAAQHTYNNTIQDFELRFRALHAQVLDYRQIWEASKVSLESEKQKFAASELKYQQGTISLNAYLTAQDDLKAAEESVVTAANDLFSSYNTYCWAVQHGILN